MEEALSANDRDEDDAQHRVSLVTSEHGYTMLLPQMDDDSDHHDNSILNSYSTNMSDEEGFQSNGDDMGDLHIHSNAIADVDSLDKSPKYVDIQLGIDLSVPTEGDCKELKSISSPADSCNIVASTNHCFAKSDPILASTSQIMLSRQQIADVVLQGNNRVVVPSSGSLADNQGLSRNHMLQSASDDSVIQFARPVQPVCLKIFYSTNNAVEVYECKWLDCTRKCTSLNDLVNHVNDDHVKLGYGKEIEYKCFWKECPRKGKGFNARYKMLIHVRTHTNEKPHSCATCGKCFSRLENLKIHTRSHTGERPYLCPVQGCSKAYSNSSDRFKHVRTHQEDKPYSCRMPGCNKRYTDPSSLRKHIKTNRHQYTGNTAQENVQVKILDGARNFFTTQGHKPPIETAQGTVIQPQTLMQHPSGAPNVPSDAAIVMYTPPANGGAPANRSPLGTHVNIITLQNFLHPRPTSNPLLSSTIAQTNTNGQLAVKETPLTLTNSITESPVKDLPSDSPLVEEEGKDQEAPLDLSKSPTLETDDNSRMDSSSYKPKWDIISMDD